MSLLSTRIDGPVAVIGDVHGQVDALLTVLDKLRALPEYQERWIVFIGDLVDRGPDPKAALDIVCDLLLEHPRTTVVCGNHELAMAGALELVPTSDYSNWNQRWVNDYLSETTFASYGVPFGELETLRETLSDRHRDLLSDLPWSVEHPEYFFVHAGLDPNQSFEIQYRILRERDYTLNRPSWLCSKSFANERVPRDCPVTVVSGHVKVPQVTLHPQRILLDTTGGDGGELSCVLLPDRLVLSSGADVEPRALTASRGGRKWWKVW